MEVIQRGGGAVHVEEGEESPFALVRFSDDGNDVIANLVSSNVVVFQRRIFIEKAASQFHFQITIFVIFVISTRQTLSSHSGR